jgi:hypothetical protein
MEYAAMDVVGPILRRLGPPDRFERFLASLDADSAALDHYLFLDDLIKPRMGPTRIAKALERLRAKGFEPRQQALLDLGFAPASAEILDAIRPALADPDWRIRFAVARSLGRLGDASSVGALRALVVGDPRRDVVVHAAIALLRLAPQLRPSDRKANRGAIAERRDRAVGHDRSALSELLRRLPED